MSIVILAWQVLVKNILEAKAGILLTNVSQLAVFDISHQSHYKII